MPDRHHFRGSYSGKDIIPLWRDAAASEPNLPAGLLSVLRGSVGDVDAPEFFAYTYAVLSAPAYVETFSEELTIRGPRIPVSRDSALFRKAVALGSRLLWLHTFGERYVPVGSQPAQVPTGIARCVRGIPTTEDEYPATVSWEAEVLRVGRGEFRPVSKAVWEFSVSDFFIVENWIKSRLRNRTGRRSSPLDEIRPRTWTADLTQELLELLWVVEATIGIQSELNTLLQQISTGPLFRSIDLPRPTTDERTQPAFGSDAEEQDEMDLE